MGDITINPQSALNNPVLVRLGESGKGNYITNYYNWFLGELL